MHTSSRDYLSRLPMLAPLSDDEFELIAGCTTAVDFAPGEILFEQGEHCDGLYIIEAGWIDIFTFSSFGEILIAQLGPKDILGELAFLDRTRRNASARATSAVRVHRINAAQFAHLRTQLRPAAAKVTRAVAQVLCHRLRKTNEHVAHVLLRQSLVPANPTLKTPPRRDVPAHTYSTPTRNAIERLAVFEELTERERTILSKHLHLCALEEDQVICAEGRPATSCLILVSGKVGVYKRLEDGYDEQIAVLGEGALIGHIALIDQSPRSATCAVESPRAVFLELRREDFDRLFHANSEPAFKVFYQVVNDLVARLRSATESLTLAKAAHSFEARRMMR